ncbi:hypothetical protein NDU88_003845 [Pleurodeles waltl]|uniref:Uncharacterized protein n=1 Tax=Pleurodeles waltl TaxID=8319 RepID=A0AAV7WU56_PLEWA|nr:hypothetical protein NDU88_003845 [Pleurodeles waltl]
MDRPAATASSYRSPLEGRPPSRTRNTDPQDCDAGLGPTPGAEGQFRWPSPPALIFIKVPKALEAGSQERDHGS